ncbi:MAG: sugar kinase [Phycisphaerae bacterium]|nr:sugar kinase [Phycisphaerae bacterium]
MPLLVTGTIGIDTVETPTASAEGVSGGSCAYFAAAAAFHHNPIRIVGAVGGDGPAEHKSILESIEGLCLDGLEERSESKTFAWGGKYFDNMNQRETLFTELGVLEEAPPAIPDSYGDSRVIFLANSHPSIQLDLLSNFPSRQLAVADTMDLWINIANDELHELFNHIDGLVINDSEAEQLTDISDPIEAAKELITRGPSFVIVKLGEHGAILVHPDGVYQIPAVALSPEQVIDPTGAGDSFAGGFLGHLASCDEITFDAMKEAMKWGTITASFTLQSFGLDGLASTTKDQMQERMASFEQTV